LPSLASLSLHPFPLSPFSPPPPTSSNRLNPLAQGRAVQAEGGGAPCRWRPSLPNIED
jgi:hypothetical protein